MLAALDVSTGGVVTVVTLIGVGGGVGGSADMSVEAETSSKCGAGWGVG